MSCVPLLHALALSEALVEQVYKFNVCVKFCLIVVSSVLIYKVG